MIVKKGRRAGKDNPLIQKVIVFKRLSATKPSVIYPNRTKNFEDIHMRGEICQCKINTFLDMKLCQWCL
jgi:hypothetical protein